MDIKQVIEKQAELFTKSRSWRTPTEFGTKLSIELSDFAGAEDKLIFLYRVHTIRNKVLEDHKLTCRKPDNCPQEASLAMEVYAIEKEITELNPSFKFLVLRQNINVDLVKKNLVDLSSYPDAGTLYQSAMTKLNQGKFERNLVDDLRVCIELLLKGVLKNDKSLENQYSLLGTHLDRKNISTEVKNMFIKLLEYYAKWHNEHVKHNDKVNEMELDFIINASSTFISFLLQVSKV